MSKELVISANRHETKVAILEDDQLVEVFFQRANEYSLAGSIHKGRVTRVLPGMQSAFVDLGLERDTFLYVSDFFEEAEEDFDRLPEPRRERENRPPRQFARGSACGRRTCRAVRTRCRGRRRTRGSSGRVAPPKRSEEDGRDRRGRSRRRRNRGRGFPESKYASSESRSGESRPNDSRSNESRPSESRYEGTRGPRPVEAAPSPESRDDAPSSSGTSDFSVLPGESLAKYTRSNIAPLDDAEEEEVRSLQSAADQAQAEAEAEEPPPADAPVELAVEEQELIVELPIAEEPSPAEIAFEEAAADEEPPSSGEIEPKCREAAQETAEAQAAETSETSETAETPQTQAPVELTAQVREQGGRYGHRMPRRMRRKMRGGGARA